MTKKEIIEKIIDLEYFDWSAGGRLSGRDVEVKNLRLRKDKAIADIIFSEPEDNYSERHNNCEYPLEKLLKEK